MSPAITATRDAALLADLHGRCFAEGWGKSAFEDLLRAENVWAFAAQAEENPAGFVVVRHAADEAEILSLGVVPEYRRRGLARALVLAAAQYVHRAGAQALFLEVEDTNIGARALYARLGFAEAGRRPAYYRTCDSVADALVLRRCLPVPSWESG